MPDPKTDDPKADDPKPDPAPDPDAGAKKALDEERKARRDAERAASDLRAKLKEFEDRDKTDGEKLTGRIAEAEKRAEAAEARAMRMEVASAKGLTAAQAKRLVGSTVDELEADADEIIETFGPSKPEGSEPRTPPTRPTERLRGGGDPTTEPEPDVRKVIESIPRGI